MKGVFTARGGALIHLLLVLSAGVFLSSFFYAAEKEGGDLKAASLTAARLDILLNEAHTYIKYNGAWPYDSGCVGGGEVLMATLPVVPVTIISGWGEIFDFSCDENVGDYSISYHVPNDWVDYIVSNVQNSERDTSAAISADGLTAMISKIYRSGSSDKVFEIKEAFFQRHGGKTEAELESDLCDNGSDSTWVHSASLACGDPRPINLVRTESKIRGWRVKSDPSGTNKFKYELEVYRMERRWETYWVGPVPFPILAEHYDWIPSKDECEGVTPTVRAFIQCSP